MGLNDLVAALRSAAGYPREQQIVDAVEALLSDPGVPPVQREQHALGELADLAGEILALHWGGRLTREDVALLEGLSATRGRDPRALIAGLVLSGIGSTATHLGYGRGLWIPAWVLRLAEHRAGVACTPKAERWVIPTQWPVPVEQVLVEGFSDYDGLLRRLLPTAPFKQPLVVGGPQFPDPWFVDEGIDLPLRDDLMTLLDVDGHAGMARLLSGAGTPVAGFAQEMAALALQGHAALRSRGRPWTGVIGFGQQIGLFEDTIVALPGWMSACLNGLGQQCPAAPNAMTEASEEVLIERAGGAVIAGQGTNLHIFPRSAGRTIRSLAIDWSAVPSL